MLLNMIFPFDFEKRPEYISEISFGGSRIGNTTLENWETCQKKLEI